MFTFIENIIWATKFTLSQFVVISVGPHVFWIQIQNWNSAKTPFNCILLERKNSQTMMHTQTMRSVTHATGYHTGWCSWYQYACSATTFLFVSTIWLNWQKRLIQHNCLLRCRNCKFLFFCWYKQTFDLHCDFKLLQQKNATAFLLSASLVMFIIREFFMDWNSTHIQIQYKIPNCHLVSEVLDQSRIHCMYEQFSESKVR